MRYHLILSILSQNPNAMPFFMYLFFLNITKQYHLVYQLSQYHNAISPHVSIPSKSQSNITSFINSLSISQCNITWCINFLLMSKSIITSCINSLSISQCNITWCINFLLISQSITTSYINSLSISQYDITSCINSLTSNEYRPLAWARSAGRISPLNRLIVSLGQYWIPNPPWSRPKETN